MAHSPGSMAVNFGCFGRVVRYGYFSGCVRGWNRRAVIELLTWYLKGYRQVENEDCNGYAGTGRAAA